MCALFKFTKLKEKVIKNEMIERKFCKFSLIDCLRFTDL